MNDFVVPALVAGALVLAAAFAPRYGVVSIFRLRDKPLASARARIETRARIEADFHRLTAENSAAVDFLFSEAKAAYDIARDRLKGLDGKAGTLIGIVTTGFGAIAILGDPAKVPSGGAWLISGLAALGIAFILALLSLAPRASKFPSLSHYSYLDTVADPANAVRIKFELVEAWLRDARGVDRATLVKGRLLATATVSLGIGLGGLALNYAVAKPPLEKPVPTIRVILAPDASPSH